MSKAKHLKFRLNELNDYANELIDDYHDNVGKGNIYIANQIDEELEQVKDRIRNLKNHIDDLEFNEGA